MGSSPENAVVGADYIAFLALVILSLLTFYIARRIFLGIIHRATSRSKTNWDDILAEQKFFRLLAYLVPSYIIYKFTPYVLEPYPSVASLITTAMVIYMITVVLLVINAFLNALAIQDGQGLREIAKQGFGQGCQGLGRDLGG